MRNTISVMEEMTFETGLGKMGRILTGRAGRGGNSRKWGLHERGSEAGKSKACWEKGSKFPLAGTLGKE